MCLAVPGQIESIHGNEPLTRMARVNFGGVVRDASLAFIPEAKPGDFIIVHVGCALSVIDQAEAQKIFQWIHEMRDVPSKGGPSNEIPG